MNAILFSKPVIIGVAIAASAGAYSALVVLYHYVKHLSILKHNRIGLECQKAGNWDGAVLEFIRAVDIDPQHAISFYNLGFAVYRGKKLWREALTYLNRAIELNAEMSEAYYTRGHLLFHTKADSALAERDLQRAIELNPKLPEAHNTLGLISISRSDWEDALGHFKKASKINSNFEAAYSNIGVACINLGKNTDAVSAFEQCMHLNPGNFLNYINLGNAYGAARYNTKSIKTLKKAAEMDPTDWRIPFWLGCLFYRVSNPESAIREFQAALVLKGGLSLIHYNLALCYDMLEAGALAKSHMDTAIELDPAMARDFT